MMDDFGKSVMARRGDAPAEMDVICNRCNGQGTIRVVERCAFDEMRIYHEQGWSLAASCPDCNGRGYQTLRVLRQKT